MGWSPLIALIAAVIMPPPVAQVVPMGREPLHHLRDANAIAAVYDVTVPPGAVMRWHAHPTAHLAVPIVMAKLRNEVVGSAAVEHLTPPGTLVFLDAGPVHRQSNIDDHAAEFIAVEFLKPTGATPPPLPPVYALALDNEVTQVLRLPLGAGARAEWPGFNRRCCCSASTVGASSSARWSGSCPPAVRAGSHRAAAPASSTAAAAMRR